MTDKHFKRRGMEREREERDGERAKRRKDRMNEMKETVGGF